MIAILLASLALHPSPAPSTAPIHALAGNVVVASGIARAGSAADDPELDKQIAAAGNDVAKLLALASSLAGGGKPEDARKVYKRVLEVDAANETAHKALNHQLYDKKWFESFAELSKYKREEDARMKAKGLARFKDQWVPEGDVPFLAMSWTRDSSGAWVNPVEAARAREVEEMRSAGWQFRADDNSWIAPDEFDKWAALQWKCGEAWLDTAGADEFHAKLGQWWQLAGEHFTIWSTCEWQGANLARWYADKCVPDLVRLFGVQPARNPHVIVLNGLDQYNRVAGGDPPLLPESEGISSLHGAYFADGYYDDTTKPPQFLGAGVCYWDRKDPKVAGWGPFWVRWAAAQSYVDAIDPSWGAIGERIGSGTRPDVQATGAAFWREKKIPRWLRYGAASYVERFARNPEAAEGADPWDLRAFAFAELKKAGGLRKLDEVFAFALDVKKLEDSGRLYEEAGVVVAYLLDGAPGDQELASKHEAFKAALKSGARDKVSEAAAALQSELAKREPAIRTFAGL